MEPTIQTVFLNVSNLERSIDFYRGVFDLSVVSRGDRAAAVMVNQTGRRQVLLLREAGRNAFHAGRGAIGLRMVSFEVASTDELELIESRLEQRDALVGHRKTATYVAIWGLDPDRIEVAVSSSLTGSQIRMEDWNRLDDVIYVIE
jgi:catechol-2,3-dioxygenase